MTGHAPHRDHDWDTVSTVFWYLFTFSENFHEYHPGYDRYGY